MSKTRFKIIIVEDDKTLVEMYNLKFKEAGLELMVVTDGIGGLELIRKEKPNLVLLDIMLPKMDGFAVLTELKKDQQTKNIPVLLLTNLGQKNDMEKGKKLGADDYIVKSSLTPSQVIEKIKLYLK